MPAHSSLRHPRRTLLKASSFDVLRNTSFEDEGQSDAGGPSTPPARTNLPRPSSLTTLNAQRQSSLAFQVGNNMDDDVFTDQPTANVNGENTISDETNTQEQEPSPPEFNYDASNENGGAALVLRDPNASFAAQFMIVDPQNIYPPSACVFAANLSQVFDDHKLEIEVTKYFSQYGTVFVKIRRDSRHMPFAFCQFTNDTDAQRAAKYGQHAMILGRPCRVEMAKANASFIIYKVSGLPTTHKEAVDALGRLGEIARVTPVEERVQHEIGLPPSMLVQYKLYDPVRDVGRAFHKHRIYRVMPYDVKMQVSRPNCRRPDDVQNFNQYEKDRRSAFFGNLPNRMNEERLKSLACSCGPVVNVEVKRKLIVVDNGKTIEICFAFVEFMRPDSIEDAIMTFHQKEIEGHILKVERKQSRIFETPNRNNQQSSRGSNSAASSMNRRASGSFRAAFNSDFPSPNNGFQEPFYSPSGGYSGDYSGDYSGNYSDGGYKQSPTYRGGGQLVTRHSSRRFSRVPMAIAGPAPREVKEAPVVQMQLTSVTSESNNGKVLVVGNTTANNQIVSTQERVTHIVSTQEHVNQDVSTREEVAQDDGSANEATENANVDSKQKDGKDAVSKTDEAKATENANVDSKQKASKEAVGKTEEAKATPKPLQPKLVSKAVAEQTPSKTSTTEAPASPTDMDGGHNKIAIQASPYQIMSPYPYPYTPIPSYMGSPLTAQGGPIMYNHYYPQPHFPETFSMYHMFNQMPMAPPPFAGTPTYSTPSDGHIQAEATKHSATAPSKHGMEMNHAEENTASKIEVEVRPEGKGKERAH